MNSAFRFDAEISPVAEQSWTWIMTSSPKFYPEMRSSIEGPTLATTKVVVLVNEPVEYRTPITIRFSVGG